MRVFLTGATGFIGSHVIPELLGAGHQVLASPGRTRARGNSKRPAPRSIVAIWNSPRRSPAARRRPMR